MDTRVEQKCNQIVNRLNRIDFQQVLSYYNCIEYLRTAYSKSNFFMDTSNHKHSFYEIHYVLKGVCSFLINQSSTIKISANEFVIIPTMCDHQITDLSDDLERFVIGISFEIETASEINREVKVHPASQNAQEIINFIIHSGYAPSTCSSAISFYMVQAFTLDLISSYDNNLIKKITPEQTEKPSYAILAKRYIHDNVDKPLTSEEIARYCSVSQRHLNRILLSEMSVTINTLIKQKKIDRIKDLLKSTEYPLKKIAEIVGISNEYSLIRFFKRETGKTPNEYRRPSFRS
ncbi:MAG: AraC family transcriptional regulator [Spirochaetales bacterium]|nr:AraC family transcriptional regulator [Spirochaetales bacterium]